MTGVSFEVPAGSALALVGDNGAGKTTLVKLLARFYAPTAGEISINETPIDRVDVGTWRAGLTACLQDFSRFEFLVRETVGVGRLASVEDGSAVRTAINAAGAEDVIAGLPSELETQLGTSWGSSGRMRRSSRPDGPYRGSTRRRPRRTPAERDRDDGLMGRVPDVPIDRSAQRHASAFENVRVAVMEGASSLGTNGPVRSRLIPLIAIAGLAAGCVAGAASGSGEGGSLPGPAGSARSSPGTSAPRLVPTPAVTMSSVPTPPPASLGPDVVPWVDRPAPSFVEPTPSPDPTDARACRAADLSVHLGQVGAGAGNINLPVEFVNRSGSTCVLNGYPTTSGLTSDGILAPLPVAQGSYFGDPGPPANIAPGESAALNISGADACQAAQNGEHRSYPTLRIGLPGGGSVDVPVGDFDTVCGVSVSRFGVPADVVPVPIPSPSPLTARITAPQMAAPGEAFAYTVTLTNPSGADYPLDPCPAYEEFVGSGPGSVWVATVRQSYLNCAAATTIPAHGSVTFQMRLQLPADQPTGLAKFGWHLQGDAGPYANAPLRVQGSGG
ncbi:MAG TPA: ATP-binding cassette domain-containing protein [Candidatus Saccharimonadales bacterium]|nr:ATP-binding cassette domain-containing protein [Candidatus Saccharimonadales bacterium]